MDRHLAAVMTFFPEHAPRAETRKKRAAVAAGANK
jgi:hypothetical protein